MEGLAATVLPKGTDYLLVIPENEIPQWFRPFRRSKNAENGRKMGWGLGLTLVKGVVDAHKGNIRVESKEGEGTSFILEIPYVKTATIHPLKKVG